MCKNSRKTKNKIMKRENDEKKGWIKNYRDRISFILQIESKMLIQMMILDYSILNTSLTRWEGRKKK